MAIRYKSYGKKQFKFELVSICIKNNIGFVTDITDEFIAEGQETWERIYKIQTKNPAVSILIFSSVDMRTNYTREIGSDAVRVVMKWETKKGNLYKKIAKHYRVQNLFQNLKGTLTEACSQIFSLNGKEFVSEVESLKAQ
jgi:hypothetical protein